MLCDAVGILRRGELILRGTVADLLHSQDVIEIALANDRPASEVVAQLGIGERVIETQGNLLRITGKAQQTVLTALVNANVTIASLNPLTRTLEDVYVQTTQTADHASPEVSARGNERGGTP